jgi:hypothetical protein
MHRALLMFVAAAVVAAAAPATVHAADARFATFNASLNRRAPGQLVADLSNRLVWADLELPGVH